MKDAVDALSPSQQALLMQYIYRGMAQRSEVRPLPALLPRSEILRARLSFESHEQAVSAVLLKWHGAVVAAAGEGCIIRYKSHARISVF